MVPNADRDCVGLMLEGLGGTLDINGRVLGGEIEVPTQRQASSQIMSRQISLFEEEESRLRKALSGIDINRLTPLDALMELKRLQEIALGKGAS